MNELTTISVSGLMRAEFDESYMLPWSVDMLYQIEPELKAIYSKATSKKGHPFQVRLTAYISAKGEAGRLLGFGARDPRLRCSGAWDVFFDKIIDALNGRRSL